MSDDDLKVDKVLGNENKVSELIAADKKYVWHHLTQHKI